MFYKRFLHIHQIVCLFLIGLVGNSCIESFEPESEVFEDTLVIEGTITDEIKQQQIILSRAFRLEEFVPVPEQNARVLITDDASNEYLFQEVAPGVYASDTSFGVQSGRNYQLKVTTNDGRQYASHPIMAPQNSPIYGLRANRATGDRDGMEILVEYDNSQTSVHYRYQFEETYKIIAPDWTGNTLRLVGPGEVVVWPLDREEHVCYNTQISNSIVLNRPKESNLNNVPEFPVRFIDRNDYIMSHRYSILVKQLAISEESFTYLKTLNELNGGEDLFSPSQPGFFSGNVFSESDGDEKVLGFFHVASVSSRRIFFNYSDFFPDEALPPYVNECVPFTAPLESVNREPTVLELLEDNIVRYHSTGLNGQFFVVPRVCGDCTVLGDIAVPEFWEE